MKNIKTFLFLIILFFLHLSCKNIFISDHKITYAHSNSMNLTDFSVFHLNDSVSQLSFNVPMHELLYKRTDITESFNAMFKVEYQLYNSLNPKVLYRNSSETFIDTVHVNKKIWQEYHINIKRPSFENGLIKIIFSDLHKNKKADFLCYYDLTAHSHQFFRLINIADQSTVFNPYVSTQDTLRIVISNSITQERLYVSYFENILDIALPPFSEAQQKSYKWLPDSSFSVMVKNNSITNLSFSKEGIYHFSVDTLSRKGITVLRFYEGYPKIISHQQMLEPLRYLTSNKEFQHLIISENKLEDIETFWIEIAKNKDRAKNLIREYYNRVLQANIFFTSYQEGWKTDRGMIYIILGTPNIIYKTYNKETWVYGDDKSLRSMNFEFIKIDNPLTDNDFSLLRSINYKENWHRAIDMWRK